MNQHELLKYSLAHNTSLGRAAGITEDQIEAIGSDDYMTSEYLAPRERAAVLWAEHVTRNTARSRDDVYEEVARVFDEAEIVELTLMSGFFNMFNRFMDSLHIPVEDEAEVDKIKRSVRVDPDRVREYLENVLEHWPATVPDAAPDFDPS